MRLINPLLLSLTLLSGYVLAQEGKAPADKVKHDYQSDVARLRKIVINSLYSHKEIFLRELVSNANDALEKLRITSLKEPELNITIKAIPEEGGKGGKIIIRDTGIGMSPEELTANLGTLAKSGTSEFISKVEGDEAGGNGNLIGAFGLGFYSSFLVADRVEVASLPPKSKKNPSPVQHVFASSADESSFEVYPDPRGNVLGRGTEITLHLKDDALEYLDTVELAKLVAKHSGFSSSFPVYLYELETKEVEDEEAAAALKAEQEAKEAAKKNKKDGPEDEDEAVVEDESDDADKPEAAAPPTPMKNVTTERWSHLNASPPLWQRDPKNVSDAEYTLFYNSYFKDFKPPLGWTHFSGDSGDGVGFKAILYLPSQLPDEFWQKPMEYSPHDLKLLVKRTFITSDLGENKLPKWASWVKVVIDADDLPLNVSRETLQNNRFLKQLRGIIVKRLLQLLQKIEKEDPKKFDKVQELYGSIIKLGAVEDTKNREKLTKLARFKTNQRNDTSFDMYLENKKQGQEQIFYLGEMGKTAEELSQSIFAEKLIARGYEVLLLTEPIDEVLFGTLREYKKIPFQDVAKAGLKFGDEDPEEEKREQEELTEKFKPLIDWLKTEAKDQVRDVVISNRLVKSPCAIVAESFGYTANVQKMMSASNSKRGDMLHEFAMKAKLLEINPRSPLIEGLLRRIEDLPTDEDERDPETEEEIKEATSILIDGALVRSGFDVTDKNQFFTRVDRVLRRSLGVPQNAKADETVKPAPPVDSTLPRFKPEHKPLQPVIEHADDGKPRVILPDHMKDKVSIEMEEIDDDGNVIPHDEL
ncbi:heat shock protein Hsp90 [Ephemerocybe angulata]|uniref:Heat shock protein Hsp90 n=1 Tax=Ephemerocybe angulata TaxID=980116 RepID=A0A8H6IBX1_9AGAR|nr:heat shock protein Hsp90 [Tulosesus angulatus]